VQECVSGYGHASESDDVVDAAYDGTPCRSLGSRIHAMTLSVPGHHHHLNMPPTLAAAAAADVADSDGQSAELAGTSIPANSAAHYFDNNSELYLPGVKGV